LILTVDPAGWLEFAGQSVRCALGRRGIRRDKHEGDGATPCGHFALRELLFRPDRLAPPICALPVRPISPGDGWCDDPSHPDYNRMVMLPHPARCERLWRHDALYDLVIPLGYNDDPPRPGLGSAIFLHVAGPYFEPTEGCVALALPDLLTLLGQLPDTTFIELPASGH
jgi:L,D-peptidoglycan transpeptidase YkuD (ErfK/YbiS/YcfS/YnhG family)